MSLSLAGVVLAAGLTVGRARNGWTQVHPALYRHTSGAEVFRARGAWWVKGDGMPTDSYWSVEAAQRAAIVWPARGRVSGLGALTRMAPDDLTSLTDDQVKDQLRTAIYMIERNPVHVREAQAARAFWSQELDRLAAEAKRRGLRWHGAGTFYGVPLSGFAGRPPELTIDAENAEFFAKRRARQSELYAQLLQGKTVYVNPDATVDRALNEGKQWAVTWVLNAVGVPPAAHRRFEVEQAGSRGWAVYYLDHSMSGLSGFGTTDPPGPSTAYIRKQLTEMGPAARAQLYRRLGWDRGSREGGNGMLVGYLPPNARENLTHISDVIRGFLSGSFGRRPKQFSELLTVRYVQPRFGPGYFVAGNGQRWS